MKQFILLLFLVALLFLLLRNPNMPKEILYNNPMGLKDDGVSKWQGMTGKDASGMLQFGTPTEGIRAGCINLIHKQTKHGYKTLSQVFSGYSADSGYASTNKYAIDILDYLLAHGFAPITIDYPIDVSGNMELICRGVIREELGLNPYLDSVIQAGTNQAVLEA